MIEPLTPVVCKVLFPVANAVGYYMRFVRVMMMVMVMVMAMAMVMVMTA